MCLSLSREFSLLPRWFTRQPRCTAKSGWVVFRASPDRRRRACMQVAACRLGIHVLAHTWEGNPQLGLSDREA